MFFVLPPAVHQGSQMTFAHQYVCQPAATQPLFTNICKFVSLSFHSYDARSSARNTTAARWSESPSRGGFGGRARFDPRSHSADAAARLEVARVRRAEEGLYRCRVDFRTAQTRNALVNLSIIGERQSAY